MIIKFKIDYHKNLKPINFTYKQGKLYGYSKHRLPLIPNISEIARELTHKTHLLIVLDRLLKISFSDKIRLLINNLFFTKRIVTKDFSTGIKLLCELEIIYTKLPHYLLHNQITDTAVALKNISIFKYYFYLAKSYNFSPGLVTFNIGPLISFLSTLPKIPSNLIIYTPLNQNGHLMNPSYDNVQEYIKNSPVQFQIITYGKK